MTPADSIENEYARRHPAEAAEQLDDLSSGDMAAAAAGLAPGALTAVMEFLTPLKALALFTGLDRQHQLEVLERATPRVAIAVIAELPAPLRKELLGELHPAVRDDLTRLMAFPENTAGRLMDRAYVGVRVEMSVGEALDRLKASKIRRARSLFVLTPDQHVAGRVDVQDLALADATEPLRDYIQPVEGVVNSLAPREEVVALLDQTRLDSVPVVDAVGRLVGVVRYRSLFEAIEDVAMADMQKMVGASADERALSSATFSVRRRLPWLHINLLTAFLAASVVGLFEDLIARVTALAVLLPVVAGQSGNAGSQALAVTMRGLALKEIGLREWRRVLNKEVLVGAINGFVLALTCGLGVYLWSSSLGLALVIAVAMLLAMIAAGISGALVPILLTRFGQDPATASSIILTTVTDVTGFFAFLGTASLLIFMLPTG